MGYADLADQVSTGIAPASWAQQVKENDRWLSHDPNDGAPSGRIWRSTNQSSVSTGDRITFDNDTGGGRYGRGGLINIDGSESRLIVPTEDALGVYNVSASARLAVTYSGAGEGQVGIQLLWADTDVIAAQSTNFEVSPGARTLRFNVSTDWEADQFGTDVGAGFSVQVIFTGMSNVDVVSVAKYSPVLTARWVGRYEF